MPNDRSGRRRRPPGRFGRDFAFDMPGIVAGGPYRAINRAFTHD
jgi:hypothetical protein